MFSTVATVTDKQMSSKDGLILSENLLSRKEAVALGLVLSSSCTAVKSTFDQPSSTQGYLQDALQGHGAASAGQRAPAHPGHRKKQWQGFQRGTRKS